MATTTTLPSFVDLMAALGLDPVSHEPTESTSSSSPSPNASPRISQMSHGPSKMRSIPSLRENGVANTRITRYAPYSSSSRRGSIASLTQSQSSSSLRSTSTSPKPRRRRSSVRLSIDSLEATAPISSYARRKTPGASPTSPTFSDRSDQSPLPPATLVLPTLPPFFSISDASSGESETESIMDKTPIIRVSKSHDRFSSTYFRNQVTISSHSRAPVGRRRNLSTST